MKRLLLALIWLLSISGQALELTAEAKLTAAEPIYQGQLIKLNLLVGTDGERRTSALVRDFKVPNAVVLPGDSPFSFQKENKVFQSFEYLVICRNPTLLRIPAIQVEQELLDEKGRSRRLKAISQPIKFQVVAPPGATSADTVTCRELTLEQTFDKELQDLKVGDALVRTITLQVEDNVAAALPEVPSHQSDGLAIYPSNPVLEDETFRGDYRGTRTESITYILESPGRYEIPEFSVQWWNPETEAVHNAVVPAVKFRVGGRALPPAEGIDFGRLLLYVVLLVFLISLRGKFASAFRKARGKLLKIWKNYRQDPWRLLLQSLKTGDPREALRRLHRWLGPEAGRAYAERTARPEVVEELEKLEKPLFATSPPSTEQWSGERLSQALRQSRKSKPGEAFSKLNP